MVYCSISGVYCYRLRRLLSVNIQIKVKLFHRSKVVSLFFVYWIILTYWNSNCYYTIIWYTLYNYFSCAVRMNLKTYFPIGDWKAKSTCHAAMLVDQIQNSFMTIPREGKVCTTFMHNFPMFYRCCTFFDCMQCKN